MAVATVPDLLRGCWKRAWIKFADGTIDDTTTVVWLQTELQMVDVRINVDSLHISRRSGLHDCTIDELHALALNDASSGFTECGEPAMSANGLRPMSRRTNDWVASFSEDTRLTGERVITAPEAALYSGGTKPHSSVKGNGRIALTNQRRKSPRPLLAASVLLACVGISCGDERDSAASGATGDITVFAAASLSAAFTELGDAFMVEYPDATVTFNFASSSALVTQIAEGAPADVYAAADLSNMTKLADAGYNAGEPVVFATNLLSILVAPGNPKAITGVVDLANPDLIVVICAAAVPCGKYAARIFENAGVTVTPKSLEENVKAVVSKVTLGEADAGVVYETDVTAAGDKAAGVKIPADINVVAQYPIVATNDAANPEVAQAFIDFVNSEHGQTILRSYGFLVP